MSFENDIRKYKVKVEGVTRTVIRAGLYGLANNIIKRTPVQTGRLRGNWQASFRQPILTTLPQIGKKNNPNPSEQVVRDNLEKVIQQYNGETFYLTNNLPYANYIDKKEGQFVGKAVKTFDRRLKEFAKKMTGKSR